MLVTYLSGKATINTYLLKWEIYTKVLGNYNVENLFYLYRRVVYMLTEKWIKN